MQVLLVTGGYNFGYLDSTELLLPSATSWTYSAVLPSPRYSLSGATLDNKVVITGTNSDTLVTAHDLRCYQYNLCNNITQCRWLWPGRYPGVQCGGGNLDQGWLHGHQQGAARRLRHQLPGVSRLLQLNL